MNDACAWFNKKIMHSNRTFSFHNLIIISNIRFVCCRYYLFNKIQLKNSPDFHIGKCEISCIYKHFNHCIIAVCFFSVHSIWNCVWFKEINNFIEFMNLYNQMLVMQSNFCFFHSVTGVRNEIIFLVFFFYLLLL